MNAIILAVAILTGLGLAFGLILAVASAVMAVPRDEKVDALREILPGANCGACGYSGCDGYAQAMVHEGAKAGLCAPGGTPVAQAAAAILGLADAEIERKTAMVRCGGCEEYTSRKMDYHGIKTCAAAKQFYGGDWACGEGCLGYGDCQAACEYGAIRMENGLAIIDPSLCRGCSLCLKACPKGLITMVPESAHGVVRCLSHDRGASVRKTCSVGCIGCMKCTKICEHDAIHVDQNLASIDINKCTGCGACADNCPVGCIDIFGYESVKYKAVATK